MVAFVQLAENISSSILAELNIPLIVVDKTSTVLYANRAFVESADDGGPLEQIEKTLVAKNHSDNIHLHDAIANASSKGERETFMINDAKTAKPQLVSVLPLPGDNGNERETLVMVQKYFAACEVFADRLRKMFRLSPSEIAIAAALVNGTDPERIAELRGAKVTTVRTQIASIMLKTRTRRQGELVALLSRVATLP